MRCQVFQSNGDIYIVLRHAAQVVPTLKGDFAHLSDAELVECITAGTDARGETELVTRIDRPIHLMLLRKFRDLNWPTTSNRKRSMRCW